MLEYRTYQKEAIDLAADFFTGKDRTRPVLVEPTGAGKSVMIGGIAKELKDAVLVLQPSKELVEQNYRKYQELIEAHPEFEPASVWSASVGIKERGAITFATIGSICKVPELFQDVRHIIVDECDTVPPQQDSFKKSGSFQKGSQYRKFFSQLPHARVLGLTATPYRMKTYNDPYTETKYSQINLLNRETPRFFNRFLHITQPYEMYEAGYLARIKPLPLEYDAKQLRFNSTGAEYTEESVREFLTRNQIVDRIPGIVQQAFAKGRRACLVFVQSVAEAEQLASITPFSGYVCANTPIPERTRLIEDFKAGNLKTLYNVGTLTVGFDYPALDTIILARPTMSLRLFVQMIGRGIRLYPGKDYCAVVDMCGNFDRFGNPENLQLVDDPYHGWVLRNGNKILSGRRLSEVVS